MKGILLICHTSPFYGKWAYNLAYSIKHVCNLPIHLVYDKKSIEGIDLSIFDSTKEYVFSKDFGYEKIDLFDKSPFEETLYLDVDAVCLKDLNYIFEELKDSIIWCVPMGKGKKTDNITYTWASNELIYQRFGLSDDIIFQTTQTSIVYFKKEAKKFFERLKENYSNRIDISEYREQWGKSKQHPDELYYSITLCQEGIDLKELQPIFFPEKKEEIGKILSDYSLLSMYGGNNVKLYAKELYDKIMNKIMLKCGKNHFYKAHNLYRNKFINIK